MHGIEIPQDPRHLGLPSGASKMIFEPMVRSAQTMHLTYVMVSTISNRTENELPLEPSPRSTIRCVRNNFRAYGTFDANHAPILHRPNTVSKHKEARIQMTHITLEFHRVRRKRFPSLWYVRRKPCTYLASRLALSLNRPKRACT